jgi:hypothetical protein
VGARRWGRPAAFAAGLLALTLASIGLGSRLRTPEQAAADAAAPSPSIVTAEVVRRVLSDAVVVRGIVVAGGSTDVRLQPPADGSLLVVTALPVREGATVSEGDVVAEVAGRPVIALMGRIPPYRDLGAGATGPDVEQLQQALLRLGLLSVSEPTFGRATAAAVGRLYERVGYRPLDPKFPSLPLSEVVYIRRLPARVVDVATTIGGSPEGPAITLSSRRLSVRATLAPGQRSLVRKGDPVRILAEISGRTARGRVVSLAPGKGEEEGTIVALIRLSSPLPDRAFGESVRVTIRADRTGGPVVAVPITAVWQRADGTAWVTVVRSDGSMHDLQVRPGPAVGGYVPVEAVRGELAAGDDVRVG